MIDSQTLSAEHAELAALAADLEAALDGEAQDTGLLSGLRWRMTRTLAAHLAKEDRVLYPRLQSSDDPAIAATAAAFAAEMGGLAEAWQLYMQSWSVERIVADRAGFRDATLALIAALRTRIAREERDLYPMVAWNVAAPASAAPRRGDQRAGF